MGLDGVELILRAEETFGVSLPEQEVCRVSTPGQLIDLVCTKLKTTDARTCRSQRAFYLLRRGMQQAWNVPRKLVQVESAFRPWIPATGEAAAWQDLSKEVSARHWPALERPKALRWSLIVAGLAIAAWALNHGRQEESLASILILMAALFAYPALASRLTRRWQVRIPSRYQSVRYLVPLLDATDATNGIGWNRAEVAERIRTILLEDFGVDPKTYQEDAHLGKDLGLD